MSTMVDFSNLSRSSVGFDRVFELLESASQLAVPENWPPYDITKPGENSYRLSMAVAGFSPDELNVTLKPNFLVVRGSKRAEKEGEYLYRGINGGEFECCFELADHMKVTGADLQSGLLTIDMVQELPEEMKPRRIEIRRGAPEQRKLESKPMAKAA